MTPGTQLGSYEILSAIGKGGMGEVWRARDRKLGREVAIKTLPSEFAEDRDRLARFEREAKLLASLNHPNIAAIYGLEESEGLRFLVLELVEGDTLAERLKRGPIQVAESLKLALQIAEALEAAHEKGVIHRDLKPANIKVTPDGKVKVLDFGLAKAFSGPETDDPQLSHSPTRSIGGTEAGIVLGTAAYMSPEQARGGAVDKRTDIWAFGCVLYEMLSGRQTWRGRTLTDVIAALVAREPDWTSIPAGVRPSIRLLLERCLEKEPSRRFRDFADIRILVDDGVRESGKPAETAATQTQSRWAVGMGIALLLVGLAVGTIVSSRFFRTGESGWSRFGLVLPAGETLVRGNNPTLALSADGRYLAYTSAGGGQGSRLFLYDSLQDETRPVLGGDGGHTPFFSPDGEWLGFHANARLRRVRVAGGDPEDLYEVAQLRGAAWGSNGEIFFAPEDGVILRIPEAGGTASPASELNADRREISHRWPALHPAGVLLFTAGSSGSWSEALIVAQDLETGESRPVVNGGTRPQYSATGHLLFVRNGRLMAAAFDAANLQVEGSTESIVEGLWQSNASGVSNYAVADQAGTFTYDSGPVADLTELVWVDADGTITPVGAEAGSYGFLALSPDGERIAVGRGGVRDEIWMWNASRRTLERLEDEGVNNGPTWAPDGESLAFLSNRRAGVYELFTRRLDGVGEAELVGEAPYPFVGRPFSWSVDGVFAFALVHPDTRADIWTMRPGEEPMPFLVERFSEFDPRFSPDGRWIAYVSNDNDRSEVHVVPHPGPGGSREISTDGGRLPVWSPDGEKLFFLSQRAVYSVDVGPGPDEFGLPVPILDLGDLPIETATGVFQVASQDRFLMLRSRVVPPPTHVNVIRGWLDELVERMPPP